MGNNKIFLFDKEINVKRLLRSLYFICGLLLVLDLFIHRHVVHSWENLWGFYPLYGFVGCVLLVLIARWMRTFLMRPYDYYERNLRSQKDNIAVDANAAKLDEPMKQHQSTTNGSDHVDD